MGDSENSGMGRAERELRSGEGVRAGWGHWEGAVRTEGQRLWGERAGWEVWRGTKGRGGHCGMGGSVRTEGQHGDGLDSVGVQGQCLCSRTFRDLGTVREFPETVREW